MEKENNHISQTPNSEQSNAEDWNAVLPTKEAAAEARKRYIQERIATGNTPEDATLRYYNNFNFNLPTYDEDKPAVMGNYRRILQQTGKLDLKLPELLREDDQKNCSPLRLQQTSREMFATIDHILEEEGVDPEKVRRLQKEADDSARLQTDFTQYSQKKLELYALCEQVFDRLRTLYTYTDLAA